MPCLIFIINNDKNFPGIASTTQRPVSQNFVRSPVSQNKGAKSSRIFLLLTTMHDLHHALRHPDKSIFNSLLIINDHQRRLLEKH